MLSRSVTRPPSVPGGRADICFLAIEPAREAEVAFTAPYAVIEGVFVVPSGSAITTVADVDRPGVRIGVQEGSAYDLFLSRTLRHASVVRGDAGVETFVDQGLDVAAGVRQPMAECVNSHPGFRLIEGRFYGDPAGDGHDEDPQTRAGPSRSVRRHLNVSDDAS